MLISGVAAGTRRGCEEKRSPAQAAVGAFSILLFFLYLLFTFALFKWRDEILGIDEEHDFNNVGLELNAEEVGDLDEMNNSSSSAAAAAAAKNHGEGSDLKMV